MSPSNLAKDQFLRSVVGADGSLEALANIDSDVVFAKSMSGLPVVLGISQATSGGPVPIAPKSGHVEIGDTSAPFLFPL